MSTFIATIGDRPLAAAPTLEDAKDEAERREGRYATAPEYRWDEHRENEWRLMYRLEGRRRFSWSQYGVVEVPTVGGSDA